ncbi:hypothetical protein [Jejuia pallidilutea]|uniref:Outer membrane protein beta-barrel domain-containing protein n=1 Tax=Jejuia pallidilutea TaxID=504487 RepID=A0A090VNE2_9FLAO|nr:hypothetical protein [Jejuia pallidilutea]GAL65493.1 hypothetical protein JCM19301_3953 [Jejuia pallidilutea]GAL70054.1 hypothetical protein JCM19302_2629 [Jejuia pallidilutea]GAL88958.1 hypothetical protein JCM19538_1947 [Jejuia pallidilutea]
MNKLLLIAVFLFCTVKSYAQDKWFSNIELDLVVPSEIEYNYSFNNTGTEISLDSKTALAILYSINYQLFNKISLGGLVGVQNQYGADFFMYKIGGNIKYYFVDSDNVYTYLHYAGNFTVDKDKFKNGNNLRIGIGFPFLKREAFNLNANVFYDINHFNLSGSEPLIFGNEKPESIFFRSYGISLGIKF